MSSTIAIIWGAPPDYEKYLRRVLWKTIKARVLERDGHQCVRCGGKAAIVHHRTYDQAVMDGLADDWLNSLCEGCHEVVHYDESGFWRSWQEAERVLATPETDASFPEPVVDLRSRYPTQPDTWKRMSAVQRSGWYHRYNEICMAKAKARAKHNPTVRNFPTSAAAQQAAFEILDQHPALVGRFRPHWQAVYVAMMSQGHLLYGNGTSITSGIKPAKAKDYFDSMARTAVAEGVITDNDAAELDALGVWHLPKPKRGRPAKVPT